jgi:hypothetical protein
MHGIEWELKAGMQAAHAAHNKAGRQRMPLITKHTK